MRGRGLCVGLIVAFAASCAPEVARPAAEWTDLFNGENLDGWVAVNGAPNTFTVRDEMIVCSGKPTCVLRTDRMYENFVLEMEWKHLKETGNAGLFLWSDPITARGQPFTRSIEVQVMVGVETDDYTSHGDVFSIHGATMTPDRPHPNGWVRCLPSEMRVKPAGNWNHYRVTCIDGTLKLEVNGKEVSGGYDMSPRKGYICLESEGSEIHFRNLRIRELPPSNEPLPPEHIANPARDFTSLYTGADLSGWTGDRHHESRWTVNDWMLESSGEGGPLMTQETFGDFELIADWRWMGEELAPPDFSRGVPPGNALGVIDPLQHQGDWIAGSWNRTRVTRSGGVLRYVHNGHTLFERADAYPDARGPIVLMPARTSVQFANIYVRRLP
jgi:hypothetical protein